MHNAGIRSLKGKFWRHAVSDAFIKKETDLPAIAPPAIHFTVGQEQGRKIGDQSLKIAYFMTPFKIEQSKNQCTGFNCVA